MITELKPLKIGDLEIKIPIIQGGMGVRVSTAQLASSVANCGAGGTIASVGLQPPDSEETMADVAGEGLKHLKKQIRKARKLTKGPLGVNIMVALGNYADTVQASVEEDIDFIISGAGLPISLPEFSGQTKIKLIPLVATARGAKVILTTWKRRYNRSPDALIVEGPLSGGHIAGYKIEELEEMKDSMASRPLLENEVREVLKLTRAHEKEYGVHIPVIAAGGIFDGKDTAKFLKMGAEGVQIGSRFVATEECTADAKFKQLYVDAEDKDITFIQSPVGMTAKVIKTKFIDRIQSGEKIKFTCNYQCLRTCNPKEAPYCIARALVNAVDGNIEEAVILAGTNVSRIRKIVPVKELINEIVVQTIKEINKTESSSIPA